MKKRFRDLPCFIFRIGRNQQPHVPEWQFTPARYCLTVFLALLPSLGFAAEGNIYGGPVGGTDIRNAYLPQSPGLYGGLVGVYGNASSAYNNNGQVNGPVHVTVNAGVTAASLTYVYPFKILDGIIASTLQQAFYIDHAKIGRNSSYDSGFGDLYSDILSWSHYVGPLFGDAASSTPGAVTPKLPYGLTVKVAYSMIFPTGRYSTSQPAPPGHNDFFFIPNAAATYLTAPNRFGDGFEFDAHFFMDFAAKNPKTNYKTGTVADLDFAVTNRVGRSQFGLAGFYAEQISSDHRGSELVAPEGRHLRNLSLGPVLAYDFPEQRATIKLKILVPVELRNTLNTTRVILGYGLKF